MASGIFRDIARDTPNLPTHIIPTKIAWLELSGKLPSGLGIPPLNIKIMLESNPLKSIMLLRRLAVPRIPSLPMVTPLCCACHRSETPRYGVLGGDLFCCFSVLRYLLLYCMVLTMCCLVLGGDFLSFVQLSENRRGRRWETCARNKLRAWPRARDVSPREPRKPVALVAANVCMYVYVYVYIYIYI